MSDHRFSAPRALGSVSAGACSIAAPGKPSGRSGAQRARKNQFDIACMGSADTSINLPRTTVAPRAPCGWRVHFETYVDPVEVSFRLGAAVVFGLLLGLDREVRGSRCRRTHSHARRAGRGGDDDHRLRAVRCVTGAPPRPRRSAARDRGVVTAWFLGGGAIIRGNGEVQGLTTAANIWLCGAVGLACGAGHYVLAAITFGFTARCDRNVPGQALDRPDRAADPQTRRVQDNDTWIG